MSSELIPLLLTAALAVVAVVSALIAVRASRRANVEPVPVQDQPARVATTSLVIAESAPEDPAPEVPAPEVRIVEGRVILTPTTRQVVDATMNRPLVRISIISHGLAYALRPESRDRIAAMMRREFQSRRRQRKRAAKLAARREQPIPSQAIDRRTITSEAWLGELPPVRHEAIES